jgi:diacylglycerol kinase
MSKKELADEDAELRFMGWIAVIAIIGVAFIENKTMPITLICVSVYLIMLLIWVLMCIIDVFNSYSTD